MMDFNINNEVEILLTDEGRRIMKEAGRNYPQEQGGGSKWQLWDLMSLFGPHLFNGCRIPFETTIRIPAPPAPAIDDGTSGGKAE